LLVERTLKINLGGFYIYESLLKLIKIKIGLVQLIIGFSERVSGRDIF